MAPNLGKSRLSVEGSSIGRTDWPVAVVRIDRRLWRKQIHARGVICAGRPDITPVAGFLICLILVTICTDVTRTDQAGNNIVSKIDDSPATAHCSQQHVAIE